LKDEVSISEQIKEAYVNYHSPWTDGTEKGYWWNKIKELSKKRAEDSNQV
tara:strand:- start:677 stop:826 length:150 start_codon:yes stop_codon:yes gene_type:complete